MTDTTLNAQISQTSAIFLLSSMKQLEVYDVLAVLKEVIQEEMTGNEQAREVAANTLTAVQTILQATNVAMATSLTKLVETATKITEQ